jgi:hypothetical protein
VNRDRNLADNLVRGWVGLYTVGLDAERRLDRKSEIDSDLWEHRNQATFEGEPSPAISISIIGRWAAGIPADLSWRASLRRSGQRAKENIMTNALGKYWQALAALTALTTGFFGIRQFFTDEVSAGISAGKVAALILLVGAGLLVLFGLLTYRTNPRPGALMVMIGVMPVALVGGLGIGVVVGLIMALAGGQGWWWLPVALASLVATVAGFGAFSAWWHAAPNRAATTSRTMYLPFALVVIGLLMAGVGVGTGMFVSPLLAVGILIALVGVVLWTRRVRAVR